MKVLHLTLKKKWFDLIASGEKKEEYRELKPYWESRFIDTYPSYNVSLLQAMNGMGMVAFDRIIFRNGYSKDAPKIEVECKGIFIGTAKPEWSDNWPGDVFIIKLGDIIHKSL